MSILIGLGLHPWYLTFHVRKLWMFVPICMCFNKLNVFVLYVFVYCMFWPLMNQDINWKVNSTLNLTGNKSLPNLYVEVDKKNHQLSSFDLATSSSTSIWSRQQYSSSILFDGPIILSVLELSRSSSNACNSSSDSDANMSAAIVAKQNWGVHRE